MSIAETYDDLAAHYHLMFEDWQLSIRRQGRVLSTLLEQKCGVPRTARILDCASGIGTQSLGLAELGFSVTGTDLSEKAVERARREAVQRGLEVDFSVANMTDLERVGPSSFDAVICMDNALSHLSTGELQQAAGQMHGKLRSGGAFVGSIRDYDRLIQEKPVIEGPSFYSDQGRRRIVLQVWDWVDREHYRFHLHITRETVEGWQTFHTTGIYRALQREELTHALEQAQFKNIQWLFPAESGYYQPVVVARAV